MKDEDFGWLPLRTPPLSRCIRQWRLWAAVSAADWCCLRTENNPTTDLSFPPLRHSALYQFSCTQFFFPRKKELCENSHVSLSFLLFKHLMWIVFIFAPAFLFSFRFLETTAISTFSSLCGLLIIGSVKLIFYGT